MRIFLIITAIIVILVTSVLVRSSLFNRVEVTCKVTSKESVYKRESHEYRVYTTCGTFNVRDDVTIVRFNSADLYGSIEPNKVYTFKVGGLRVGYLSLFPNILQIRSEN